MEVVGMSGLDDADFRLGNCLTCSGTGHLNDDTPIKCKDCNGSGHQFSGLHMGDPCVFCGIGHDDVAIGACTFAPENQTQAKYYTLVAGATQEENHHE